MKLKLPKMVTVGVLFLAVGLFLPLFLSFRTWFGIRILKQVQDDGRLVGSVLAADSNWVTINEVMPNPVEGGEWVELKNSSTSAVLMTGWQIRDNTSADLLPEATISAQSYAVIVPDRGTFESFFNPAESVSILELGSPIGNQLANSGDIIQLVDPVDSVIDEFSYPSSTKGWSWAWFEDSWEETDCSTPGLENEPTGCEPDDEDSDDSSDESNGSSEDDDETATEPQIDFETPSEVTAGESFEVKLALEDFDPDAEYRVKFLASADEEKFYDGKTLSDDEDKYLAWNASWSSFPKFETNSAGAAEFDFEALIKDDAEKGDYKAKIRIRNEETESSTDSGVKELEVQEVDDSDSSDEEANENAQGVVLSLTQLPATGPAQDLFLLLGEVFLCLGLALKLIMRIQTSSTKSAVICHPELVSGSRTLYF